MTTPKKGFIKYYIAGGIMFVATLVVFVGLLVSTIMNVTNTGTRMVAPGEAEIELEEAGKYVIFYEKRSVIDGKVYDTSNQNLLELAVSITDQESNEVIQVKKTGANSTYSTNGREGVSVLSFEVDEATTVLVEAAHFAIGTDIVLNIAPDMTGDMFVGITSAILIPMLLFFLGGILIVVGLIKNVKYARAKKM